MVGRYIVVVAAAAAVVHTESDVEIAVVALLRDPLLVSRMQHRQMDLCSFFMLFQRCNY